jgi:hypothetical protein
MGLPKQWTMEIGSFVKSLAPHKSMVDGTCGVNQTNLPIDTVNIYSGHCCPLSNSQLQADIAIVAAANKSTR